MVRNTIIVPTTLSCHNVYYTEQTTAKFYLHANIHVQRSPDQKSCLRKGKLFPVRNAINVPFTKKNYTFLIILHGHIIKIYTVLYSKDVYKEHYYIFRQSCEISSVLSSSIQQLFWPSLRIKYNGPCMYCTVHVFYFSKKIPRKS